MNDNERAEMQRLSFRIRYLEGKLGDSNSRNSKLIECLRNVKDGLSSDNFNKASAKHYICETLGEK